MRKPTIFAVDDDPQVLRAVTSDLRRKFQEKYRIVSAESGDAALDACQKILDRGEDVALFLVDQRMPGMSGTEFLKQATQLFPLARKVLLTAYADTHAAIEAINEVRLHHYLMKPWEPPEDDLYPVIVDQLEEWKAHVPPSFEGIRIIGHRWNADSHRVKDFLARNQFPYVWEDIEDNKKACSLYTSESKPQLPLVVLVDGTQLQNPSLEDLAVQVGLKTIAGADFYDLVIAGGGPAGLAAAVYGASEGLKVVMIEREAPGGQAGTSSRIENYLGFPDGLSGRDLARRAVLQAHRFGVEIISGEVTSLTLDNQYRKVKLASGPEIACHALLIATGVSYRLLDAPGVEELTGRGVYYGAAMTEALNCCGDEVFVVGGANSAGQAALYLAEYATKVHILVRGQDMKRSMSQYLIDEIGRRENIEVHPNTTVKSVQGTDSLEGLTLIDSQTNDCRTVPARALFIFIGASPRTDWLEGVVERDQHGFVLTGPEITRDGTRPRGWDLQRDPFLLETSVSGVFAAGDVRQGSVKRVASGVGEGSIAVSFIHQHLASVR